MTTEEKDREHFEGCLSRLLVFIALSVLVGFLLTH